MQRRNKDLYLIFALQLERKMNRNNTISIQNLRTDRGDELTQV